MSLPVVVPIGQGESLTSNARRTIEHITGAPAPQGRLYLGPIGVVTNFATAELVTNYSALTEQPIAQVSAATYRSVAAAIPPLDAVLNNGHPIAAAARQTWLWPRSTQACRPCLRANGGQWQLRWRLPWTYICLNHHTPLETHCPRCGRLFNEHHLCPRSIGQDNEWLTWPTTQTLWTDPDPTDQAAGQQRIHTALDGTPQHVHKQFASAVHYLDAIRGLVGLIWHADNPSNPHGRRIVAAPPRDTHARAELITRSIQLLNQPPEQTVETLASLTAKAARQTGLRTWIEDHTRPSPILDPLFAELIHCRVSPGSPSRRPPANTPRPAHRSPHHVPQILPPHQWRHLACHWTGSTSTGRCYASMLYIKLTLGGTWAEAGAALDLPPALAISISRIGAREVTAPAAPFVQAVRDAFDPMAEESGQPGTNIDYAERRQWCRNLQARLDVIDDLRHVLRRQHLTDTLLIERTWTVWALGHPKLSPYRGKPERLELQRAAVQRRRWTQDETGLLNDWCSARLATPAPTTLGDNHGPSPARSLS